MPEIRELDTDAYFVAVFRDPIDTIRCFVNKGIFRRAGPDTLFLAHENMPGWPPLNHWVRCMSNILVSMKDTDDWEVWWIDEIPGKKLNKSKKRRDLVDFEIDDINNWSGRVLPRMHEAHAESLQRGRPILEGIPND
jgi:hypothetical protein